MSKFHRHSAKQQLFQRILTHRLHQRSCSATQRVNALPAIGCLSNPTSASVDLSILVKAKAEVKKVAIIGGQIVHFLWVSFLQC